MNEKKIRITNNRITDCRRKNKEFRRLDSFAPTTFDDPERGVWFASNKSCGFWTDNWALLGNTDSGIPICPVCGSVGMQMKYASWEESVIKFEKNGHPRYEEYLEYRKGKCASQENYKKWEEEYEDFLKKEEREEES